jgi:L-fuculose-phosphate aldolase
MLGSFLSCGKVAVVPYHPPGSQALVDASSEALSNGANCLILENHGVLVVGNSLHEAFDRFVSLEFLAESIIHAQPLGRPVQSLDLSTIQQFTENKEQYTIPFIFYNDNRRIMTGMEKERRAELCKYVHRAYEQKLITSSSGSFSIRVPTSTTAVSFLITPTCVDRKELEAADVCYLTRRPLTHGKGYSTATEQTGENCTVEDLVHFPVHHPSSPEYVLPSRAVRIHDTVFQHHPQVECILVTQPSYATAFCLTGSPLDARCMPEAHSLIHDVQTLTLSQALDNNGRALSQTLDPKNGKTTILVQNYGVVTVGSSLFQAFVQLETLESVCSATIHATTRGFSIGRAE